MNDEQKLKLLRAAIIKGEESGNAGILDIEEIIATAKKELESDKKIINKTSD